MEPSAGMRQPEPIYENQEVIDRHLAESICLPDCRYGRKLLEDVPDIRCVWCSHCYHLVCLRQHNDVITPGTFACPTCRKLPKHLGQLLTQVDKIQGHLRVLELANVATTRLLLDAQKDCAQLRNENATLKHTIAEVSNDHRRSWSLPKPTASSSTGVGDFEKVKYATAGPRLNDSSTSVHGEHSFKRDMVDKQLQCRSLLSLSDILADIDQSESVEYIGPQPGSDVTSLEDASSEYEDVCAVLSNYKKPQEIQTMECTMSDSGTVPDHLTPTASDEDSQSEGKSPHPPTRDSSRNHSPPAKKTNSRKRESIRSGSQPDDKLLNDSSQTELKTPDGESGSSIDGGSERTPDGSSQRSIEESTVQMESALEAQSGCPDNQQLTDEYGEALLMDEAYDTMPYQYPHPGGGEEMLLPSEPPPSYQETMQGWMLSYVDFAPVCLTSGGVLHKPEFEKLTTLVFRANRWLREHPELRIKSCETVELSSPTVRDGVDLDTQTAVHRFSSSRRYHFKALRVWITPREDDDTGLVAQIGYVNIMPACKDPGGFFAKPTFDSLETTIKKFNKLTIKRPLPGRLLCAETVRVKFCQWRSLPDPDATYWREHSYFRTSFLRVVRLYYISGPRTKERIGWKDFDPQLKNPGRRRRSFLWASPTTFEDTDALIERVREWLSEEKPGFRFTNIQTIHHKMRGKGGKYNGKEVLFSETPLLSTWFVQSLRVYYACVKQQHGRPPPPLTGLIGNLQCRTFFPDLEDNTVLGNRDDETMFNNLTNVNEWLTHQDASIQGVETMESQWSDQSTNIRQASANFQMFGIRVYVGHHIRRHVDPGYLYPMTLTQQRQQLRQRRQSRAEELAQTTRRYSIASTGSSSVAEQQAAPAAAATAAAAAVAAAAAASEAASASGDSGSASGSDDDDDDDDSSGSGSESEEVEDTGEGTRRASADVATNTDAVASSQNSISGDEGAKASKTAASSRKKSISVAVQVGTKESDDSEETAPKEVVENPDSDSDYVEDDH